METKIELPHTIYIIYIHVYLNIHYTIHILSCKQRRIQGSCNIAARNTRENLDNREGQTDCRPVDKYHFTWTTKGVRCYLKFRLWRAFIEGRGVYKVTTISVRWVPLSFYLYSLWGEPIHRSDVFVKYERETDKKYIKRQIMR